jgi:hypothetical protein
VCEFREDSRADYGLDNTPLGCGFFVWAAMSDHLFDVFLCHNSKDKPAVKEIGKKLKARGLRPWLDEWALRPGLPWQRLLEEQIASIGAAAVFVGEDGIGPWQQQELDGFLRHFVSRGIPVIPVLLQTAPPQRPKLPVFLANNTWVIFEKLIPTPWSD